MSGSLPSCTQRDIRVGPKHSLYGSISRWVKQMALATTLKFTKEKLLPDGLDRLKVLINSSTPIVVMETSEEVRAVNLVRTACSELNMATFEWTIADGLVRSSSTAAPSSPLQGASLGIQARIDQSTGWRAAARQARSVLSPGGGEADRLTRSLATSMVVDSGAAAGASMYNSRDPVQALANMESMTVEAVFVLKDFHRHMDNPVVVRRLRDVGQKFSANRRTLVLIAPAIEMPPELVSLVEFLDLPLPARDRLREIIRETYTRMAGTHTLRLQLDSNGVDAMAANLRGLTEEAAERAISQTIVGRQALSPECITDVLDAKKALLKRSEMLEFVDSTANMSSVGGLENLKTWLAQRRNSWDAQALQFGLDPPKGVIILGVQGCGKSLCARAVAGEWKLPLVKFDTAAVYDKFIGETEKRIQKVFQLAEGLVRSVLWLTDLEKVFAGG